MYCSKILLGETVLLSSQRGTNVKTISLKNEYIDILFLYISYRILIAHCKKMYKIKHLNNCTFPTLTFLLQMTIKKCQLYQVCNDIGSRSSNIRNLEEISMHENSEFTTVIHI